MKSKKDILSAEGCDITVSRINRLRHSSLRKQYTSRTFRADSLEAAAIRRRLKEYGVYGISADPYRSASDIIPHIDGAEKEGTYIVYHGRNVVYLPSGKPMSPPAYTLGAASRPMLGGQVDTRYLRNKLLPRAEKFLHRDIKRFLSENSGERLFVSYRTVLDDIRRLFRIARDIGRQVWYGELDDMLSTQNDRVMYDIENGIVGVRLGRFPGEELGETKVSGAEAMSRLYDLEAACTRLENIDRHLSGNAGFGMTEDAAKHLIEQKHIQQALILANRDELKKFEGVMNSREKKQPPPRRSDCRKRE